MEIKKVLILIISLNRLAFPAQQPEVKELTPLEIGFFAAILDKNPKRVQELVDQGVNVNAVFSSQQGLIRHKIGATSLSKGTSALHLTGNNHPYHYYGSWEQNAQIDIYKILLKAGAQINHRDSCGRLPTTRFYSSSIDGENFEEIREITKLFLENNALFETVSEYSWPPLRAIARSSEMAAGHSARQELYQELTKTIGDHLKNIEIAKLAKKELTEKNVPVTVAALIQNYVTYGSWERNKS